ncbi:MAG: universal stress protein, partial [Pseudaminobacter sp.]
MATDFSPLSDRALRRAVLVAKQNTAGLVLVHVVDDERPRRFVDGDIARGRPLLEELAATLRDIDGVDCQPKVSFGAADEGVIHDADELNFDLILVGPHRRHAVKDVFIGTTAERIIRRSGRPVLMAKATPAAPYSRMLIATDLTDGSTALVSAVRKLDMLENADVAVLHAFDVPLGEPTQAESAASETLSEHVAGQRALATQQMAEFLATTGLSPEFEAIQSSDLSVAELIEDRVQDWKADLVVIGTHGRSGIGRLLLGSNAEEVMRRS